MSEKLVDDVLSLVGATPLLRLRKVADGEGMAEVLGKHEAMNPSGSVKDRAALAMIRAAEADGKLAPGATVVEATSGNTGISLAMISAVRGYRCVIVMPEDMSNTRRHVLRAYGAEVRLTPADRGMAGAMEEARRFVAETPGAFMCSQFENPANPDAHVRSTAEEIWSATGGELAAFVAGVGTGGTVTGVARALKAKKPDLLVVGVEPKGSPVLGGGSPGYHAIQGLGAGFVPPVFDRALVDRIEPVSDIAADRMSVRLAREEGLLVGTSAGANVWAAVKLAKELGVGKRVVTILCDTGERYLG